MNKEIDVNWRTTHKEIGEIIIKTLDLENGYMTTNRNKHRVFGIDSLIAKSCFPTIPMLMMNLIKHELTTITAENTELENSLRIAQDRIEELENKYELDGYDEGRY